MFIGAHISIAKGMPNAVRTALNMEGNTLQIFTRNPRGGSARELKETEAAEAFAMRKEKGMGPLVAHAPYTYNLCSNKPGVREFSLRTIKEDLLRVKILEVENLVMHVGTHGGQGVEKGLELVTLGLREILADIPPGVNLLLEGMAGEGTELGYTFEQLASLLKGCDNHPQLGICLDSCHLTGAGYDLSKLDAVKEELDKIVGLERLRAFHLNDSMFPLGSRRDRHAKLGEGKLGLEIIRGIVCDSYIQTIPMILETPNDDEGYAREIALVKKLCQ